MLNTIVSNQGKQCNILLDGTKFNSYAFTNTTGNDFKHSVSFPNISGITSLNNTTPIVEYTGKDFTSFYDNYSSFTYDEDTDTITMRSKAGVMMIAIALQHTLPYNVNQIDIMEVSYESLSYSNKESLSRYDSTLNLLYWKTDNSYVLVPNIVNKCYIVYNNYWDSRIITSFRLGIRGGGWEKYDSANYWMKIKGLKVRFVASAINVLSGETIRTIIHPHQTGLAVYKFNRETNKYNVIREEHNCNYTPTGTIMLNCNFPDDPNCYVETYFNHPEKIEDDYEYTGGGSEPVIPPVDPEPEPDYTIRNVSISPTSYEGDTSETGNLTLTVAYDCDVDCQLHWYKNDTILTGETSRTLTVAKNTTDSSGVYKCKIYNNKYSIFSDTANISITQYIPVQSGASLSVIKDSNTDDISYGQYLLLIDGVRTDLEDEKCTVLINGSDYKSCPEISHFATHNANVFKYNIGIYTNNYTPQTYNLTVVYDGLTSNTISTKVCGKSIYVSVSGTNKQYSTPTNPAPLSCLLLLNTELSHIDTRVSICDNEVYKCNYTLNNISYIRFYPSLIGQSTFIISRTIELNDGEYKIYKSTLKANSINIDTAHTQLKLIDSNLSANVLTIQSDHTIHTTNLSSITTSILDDSIIHFNSIKISPDWSTLYNTLYLNAAWLDVENWHIPTITSTYLSAYYVNDAGTVVASSDINGFVDMR